MGKWWIIRGISGGEDTRNTPRYIVWLCVRTGSEPSRNNLLCRNEKYAWPQSWLQRSSRKEVLLQQQQQTLLPYDSTRVYLPPPSPWYRHALSHVSLAHWINEAESTSGQTPAYLITHHLLYTVGEAIFLLGDMAYVLHDHQRVYW